MIKGVTYVYRRKKLFLFKITSYFLPAEKLLHSRNRKGNQDLDTISRDLWITLEFDCDSNYLWLIFLSPIVCEHQWRKHKNQMLTTNNCFCLVFASTDGANTDGAGRTGRCQGGGVCLILRAVDLQLCPQIFQGGGVIAIRNRSWFIHISTQIISFASVYIMLCLWFSLLWVLCVWRVWISLRKRHVLQRDIL